MIRHFETRLADFLGTRLEPPFQGRVSVVSDTDGGPGPVVSVGVIAARPVDVDFGSRRPELVSGADDPRRVVRLECEVAVRVTPGAGAGRPQTMAGLDAVTYLLDDPALRRPESLASPDDDPGFVLESMRVAAVLPEPDGGTPRVELVARGWFWPPEAPGITGEPITEARIRASQLPVSLSPWPLRLRAGRGAVHLVLEVGGVGTMVVEDGSVDQEPFGELAVQVLDAGGRPGAGSLAGGVAGPSGSRIVELATGRATIEYTPPAEPAVDRLVVSMVRTDGGGTPAIGIQLAEFRLEVLA